MQEQQEIVRAITSKNRPQIERLIADNHTIQNLNLARIPLDDRAVEAIAKGLVRNKNIIRLYLDHCSIDAKGGKHLATMLSQNTTLTYVNLVNNYIRESGKDFGDALKVNTTLKELDLCLTHMTDDAAIAIAEALKTNTTLQSLSFRLNHFSRKVGDHFLEMVQHNNTLRKFDFVINNYSGEPIEQKLSWNKNKKQAFLQLTIFLANDHQNEQSKSFFRRLPLELVLMILSFYPVDNVTDRSNFAACAQFVFANINKLKPYLTNNCGVHLKQTSAAPRFSFFCPDNTHNHMKSTMSTDQEQQILSADAIVCHS